MLCCRLHRCRLLFRQREMLSGAPGSPRVALFPSIELCLTLFPEALLSGSQLRFHFRSATPLFVLCFPRQRLITWPTTILILSHVGFRCRAPELCARVENLCENPADDFCLWGNSMRVL